MEETLFGAAAQAAPSGSKAKKPKTGSALAAEHKAADEACGRNWYNNGCQCVTCREARGEIKQKRPNAKKIKGGSLGPFKTACTTFEKGKHREIEVTRLTEFNITYRVKGFDREYTIPHETALIKAMGLTANMDTGPRTGRIKRG